MTVLQVTKHKSTSTLCLCDVCSVEMKLTVITVCYGVLAHWVPKSFDNCSSYASVISLLIFFFVHSSLSAIIAVLLNKWNIAVM